MSVFDDDGLTHDFSTDHGTIRSWMMDTTGINTVSLKLRAHLIRHDVSSFGLFLRAFVGGASVSSKLSTPYQ
jgi:hypothetical protein